LFISSAVIERERSDFLLNYSAPALLVGVDIIDRKINITDTNQ
jgi:hypothetical protein